MFSFLTRSRRMPGGLVFGPPAWTAATLHNASPTPAALPHEQSARAPHSREDLLHLLDSLALNDTSPIHPPLADQLRDLEHRRCRALVLNLLPTQPEYALGAGLTALALDDLRTGLSAIQRALRAEKVIAVVDRHDGHTRRLWKKGARGHRRGHETCPYEVRSLLNRYPQAHPTTLTRTLFGRRLQVGHLPTRNNRVILDPAAAWAFGRYVRAGEPFSHRPVQLFFDRASAPPGAAAGALLVVARIGTPIADLLHQYHIRTADRQIILNGMLAGEELEPNAAITPRTEALAVRELPVYEPAHPCIACGWCVDVCPTSLVPINLFDLAGKAQHFIASAPLTPAGGGGLPTTPDPLRTRAAREALHCIGCGLCSYVCPTRLPLTQKTLRLRQWILAEPPAAG
jgi:electron transport complex protein RnfC